MDTLTLTFEDRCRRRIRLTTDGGEALLLDLMHALVLADGDGLFAEDRSWFAVRAANEAVLEIRGEGPNHLTRLAWHLGNRHVPTEIRADGRLRIRDDHVLAEMLSGLGGWLEHRQAPFHPEAGAYAGAAHGHD